MTQHTEDLIKRFSVSHDVTEIPGILLAIQEEDNVGNIVEFKNCFRQLRNLAAHEPATITSQLLVGENENNVKLVFQSERDQLVTMDTIQFTAWMFDLYKKLHSVAYLAFWKAFMKVLYSEVCEISLGAGILSFEGKSTNLISCYAHWIDFSAKYLGVVRTVNASDPYIVKLFKENPRVFWRMAYPNMFEIVRCYVNGVVSLKVEENIDFFLSLFKAMEG